MKRNRNLSSIAGWSLLIAGFLTVGGFAPSRADAQTTKTTTQVQTRTESKKIKVDVNAADTRTLESLPGIGPVLARKIVAGRPYRNVADLGKVKGLSETKLNMIKDDVSFGATTTPKSEIARTQKEKTVVTKTTVPETKTTVTETKTTPREASTTVQTSSARNSRVEPLAPTGRTPRTLAAGAKVNINTATVEELDRLPGIGPVKAKAIVDYRTQNGKFKSIEEIEKVKGIKAGEFSKIKDSIELSD